MAGGYLVLSGGYKPNGPDSNNPLKTDFICLGCARNSPLDDLKHYWFQGQEFNLCLPCWHSSNGDKRPTPADLRGEYETFLQSLDPWIDA